MKRKPPSEDIKDMLEDEGYKNYESKNRKKVKRDNNYEEQNYFIHDHSEE